jgi:uncharacterized membrane protein
MIQDLNQQLKNIALLKEKASAIHLPGEASVSQPWTPEMVMLISLSILIFGLLVLLIMAWLVIKGKEGDQILRVCALPLIIVAAIVLVVIGYTNEQISPVMGLLGAIAGYLLGSKRPADTTSTASSSPKENS